MKSHHVAQAGLELRLDFNVCQFCLRSPNVGILCVPPHLDKSALKGTMKIS